MLYQVQYGESPASIARKFGVTITSLINANRHKPTQVVAGQRTWQALAPNETISVPVGGLVGDAASDAIAALVRAGGPCNQANVGYVCAIQAALGLKVDGKYGNDTATAARRIVPSAPAGCSPAPLWWGKKGDNKCAGVPLPAIPPVAAAPALPSLPGIPALPISLPAPPAAVAPLPVAAAGALLAIDPCLSVNAGMVCAAQLALGLTADGKYGSGTADAVRRAVGSAPPPCSPAPLWWGKKGENKCGGALPSLPSPLPSPAAPIPMPAIPPPVSFPTPEPFIPPPVSIPMPAPSAPPIVATPAPAAPPPAAAPAPAPGAPPSAQPIVVAPEPKKALSTGAIVAGAVGVAALVGLVAVAASGSKRSTSTSRTTTVRRAPARRSKPRKKSKSRKR